MCILIRTLTGYSKDINSRPYFNLDLSAIKRNVFQQNANNFCFRFEFLLVFFSKVEILLQVKNNTFSKVNNTDNRNFYFSLDYFYSYSNHTYLELSYSLNIFLELLL